MAHARAGRTLKTTVCPMPISYHREDLQSALALVPPPGNLLRPLLHTWPINGCDEDLQTRRHCRHFFQHEEASHSRNQRAKAKPNDIKYFVHLYMLLLDLRFRGKLSCLKSPRFRSGDRLDRCGTPGGLHDERTSPSHHRPQEPAGHDTAFRQVVGLLHETRPA